MVCSMATKIANKLFDSGVVKNQQRTVGDFNAELAQRLENEGCEAKRGQIKLEQGRDKMRNKTPLDLRGKTLREIHSFFTNTANPINVVTADFRIHMGGERGTMAQLGVVNEGLHREIRTTHGDIYRKFGIEMDWGLNGQIGISANTPENIDSRNRMGTFMEDQIVSWHRSGACGCCQSSDWRWDNVGQIWSRNWSS